MRPTGLYIVRRDFWYTERTVWLIAGLVLLAATGAALLHPIAIVFTAAVGLFSISTGVSGYCVIGTLLRSLGMRSALAEPGPPRTLGPIALYRMRTDAWYLERSIYVVVGVNLTLASSLVLLHTGWWLLFTGFVGWASVAFAVTGFCPVANVLYRLGFEPRLRPTKTSTTGEQAA